MRAAMRLLRETGDQQYRARNKNTRGKQSGRVVGAVLWLMEGDVTDCLALLTLSLL